MRPVFSKHKNRRGRKKRRGGPEGAVSPLPYAGMIRIRFQGSFRPRNGTLSVTLPQRILQFRKAYMDWVVAVNEIVAINRILPFTAAASAW
jgi:hypothetical protein